MFSIEIILAAICAYLFGSVSSAIIVCKLWQLPDPRTQGSKNPGATNVLRIGGRIPALITLLGDVLKGFIPVLIVKLLSLPSEVIAITMFFAFIGHLYPIFFRFEGGKGVATLLGCLFALSFPVGICWLITFGIILMLSRYVSVASMLASFIAPLYVWFFTHNLLYVITLFIMAFILIYRHRSNIQNIRAGKELTIDDKKIK